MGDEPDVDAVAGSETRHRLTRLQRAMVKTMSNAVSVAALSQVTREIDMSSVIRDREARTARPSINTYVMAAVAGRLGSHPLLNGRLEGREVVVPDHVNLGIAVSVAEGLVVPIVHGADRMSFTELGEALAVAAGKARDNNLSFDDIEGGTFTVSNLGMFGIDGGFAIPPQLQSAILLVGRVHERFVPDDDGLPALCSLCSFGLTFDHRFIDGAAASALLADVAAALADAGALVDNTGRPT